jgi:hypothetical protein
MVVNQQGEIIFTLFGLFAESVKNKTKICQEKKRTNGDGFKLVVNYYFYDRSKLENKRIHLWLMMNKQPL